MCTCSHGCPAQPLRKNSINWRPLRHRLAYNADGTGQHSGQRAELFASGFFHHVCRPIFRDIDAFSRFGGGPTLTWIGNVGVTACKSGMHAKGRAFDLTRVQMRGWRVDCNTAWRAGLASQRRYLGVAATCRRHTGTVLTTWYNAAHGNHIHFDNGVPFTRIRPNKRSDTTLVQAACNLLHGAGLAVDGVWGPKTDGGYHTLRKRMGLGGLDPRNNAGHAATFLTHIAVIGLAGASV